MKWQWFLGGQIMFWISIVLFIILIFSFTATYIIDPAALISMRKQAIDSSAIQYFSEKYVKNLGITMEKPIKYNFVRYTVDNGYKAKPNERILLGTFHEWNGTYYIDISVDLYKMSSLEEVVIHETRHMIVQELKNKNIIDLSKYTEEIAQQKNDTYNTLFDMSVKLLKMEEK